MSKSRVFRSLPSPPAAAWRTVNDVIDIVEPRSTVRTFVPVSAEHHLSLLPPETLPLNAFLRTLVGPARSGSGGRSVQREIVAGWRCRAGVVRRRRVARAGAPVARRAAQGVVDGRARLQRTRGQEQPGGRRAVDALGLYVEVALRRAGRRDGDRVAAGQVDDGVGEYRA